MADLSHDEETAGDGSLPRAAAPVDALAQAIAPLTGVLLAVARGDFEARAPRSFAGDPVDVMAYLINATAEEIGDMVGELERQREDLRATRDQLIMAEKLSALGQLSAGMAHELNQPLTAIRMCIEWMMSRPHATVGENAPDLDLMSEAVRRMSRIIDGIRSFGRSSPLGRRPVEPTAPLEAALLLASDVLRHLDIEVERSYDSPLPQVMADPDRLQQVFLNLVLNARDALEGLSNEHRPRIRVEVRATTDGVQFAVADNGPGVAPADVPRLFDPFFTTKAVGKGMGLGLSISHGIVAEHGAALIHEPVSTGGTRFSFLLRPEPAS